jgi:hypothetical protein
MTEGHADKADQVERELDDLERRSDRLEDEIDSTREDWERKKRDDSVPGAAGQQEQAESEGGPETDYPAKGDPE